MLSRTNTADGFRRKHGRAYGRSACLRFDASWPADRPALDHWRARRTGLLQVAHHYEAGRGVMDKAGPERHWWPEEIRNDFGCNRMMLNH